MRSRHVRKERKQRRGAANTSTVAIVVIAALIGGLLFLACGGALLLGLMLPALGQARQSAMDVRSQSQLRAIHQSYLTWREGAEPDAPFTLDVLVEEHYLTPELLLSPHGPVGDGGGDYWYLPLPAALDGAQRTDEVIGYDRAMYAAGRRVAVLFGDGRADVVATEEFERLIAAPPNEQTDFDLPPPGQ